MKLQPLITTPPSPLPFSRWREKGFSHLRRGRLATSLWEELSKKHLFRIALGLWLWGMGSLLLGTAWGQTTPTLTSKPSSELSKTTVKAGTSAGTRVLLDQVIAIVNQEVITGIELDRRVRRIIQELNQRKITLPPMNVLEEQVLERMILERVQLQFARQTGLRVDDSQLQLTLRRIAQQNNTTLEGLRETVEKEGLSMEQFRTDLRNEILLTRLRERETSDMGCTDGEVSAWQAEANVRQTVQQELSLGQILVRVPEQASPLVIEDRRQKIQKIREELNRGADFASLAVRYSDAADAFSGGLLSLRATNRLPQLFVEAVKSLEAGQVSEIVRSPNGFHLLKLYERKMVLERPPLEETQVRHILIKINELMPSEEARLRLGELRGRLKNKTGTNLIEEFAQLATAYSNDLSRERGGELGWVYPGDLVPEFEHAMNQLPPGGVSEPVQSPFGWHLILVLGRRTESITAERIRGLACQAIRERKGEETWQEWLRQERDRAYVDLRFRQG